MSYYELESGTSARSLDNLHDKHKINIVDSEAAWRGFAAQAARYWSDFVLKWLTLQRSNVQVFRYEDLIADSATVKEVFGFCFGHRYPMKVDHHVRQLRDQATARGGLRQPGDFRYDADEATALIMAAIDPRALALAGYD